MGEPQPFVRGELPKEAEGGRAAEGKGQLEQQLASAHVGLLGAEHTENLSAVGGEARRLPPASVPSTSRRSPPCSHETRRPRRSCGG